MPRKVDLVGRRFGRLTVIADSGERDPKRGVLWECVCDCGAQLRVTSSKLTSGDKRSCGCLQRDTNETRSAAADLTGQKIGRLTVVRRLPSRRSYECVCDCGNLKIVDRNSLRDAKTTSCGCLRAELSAARTRTHGRSDSVEARMLYDCRVRARRHHVPCTITLDDIHIPDVCPALGIPLVGGVDGSQPDCSPSLDRLRPELGYVPGNIAVISRMANRIKQNCTSAQVRAVGEWMRANGL